MAIGNGYKYIFTETEVYYIKNFSQPIIARGVCFFEYFGVPNIVCKKTLVGHSQPNFRPILKTSNWVTLLALSNLQLDIAIDIVPDEPKA